MRPTRGDGVTDLPFGGALLACDRKLPARGFPRGGGCGKVGMMYTNGHDRSQLLLPEAVDDYVGSDPSTGESTANLTSTRGAVPE
jgi:hypothetical protein